MTLAPTTHFSVFFVLVLDLAFDLDHDFIMAHTTVPATFDQVLLLAVVSPLVDVSLKMLSSINVSIFMHALLLSSSVLLFEGHVR